MVIDQKFGHVNDLAWSPDGSRLAFQAAGGGPVRIEHVWIVGVDGSGLTDVSQEGDAWGAALRWSPTSQQLAYESPGGIWIINADGSGLRQVALPGRRDPVWSPDGSHIAYLDEDSLYVADLDGTHARALGTLELTRRPNRPWAGAESESRRKPPKCCGFLHRNRRPGRNSQRRSWAEQRRHVRLRDRSARCRGSPGVAWRTPAGLPQHGLKGAIRGCRFVTEQTSRGRVVAASPSSPSCSPVQRRFPCLRYPPSRSALNAPCA